MKPVAKAVAWTFVALCFSATLALAEGPTFKEALTGGKPMLDLRYRYENVSDDAVGNKKAQASTLRTVLGYQTQAYKGWSFRLDAEDVTAIGSEDGYRNAGAGSLSNGVTDRPVVADPELTEFNQAYLRYENAATALTVGRQEIVIGDARFVGNVGWRQNHQSFDAFRVTNKSLDRVGLSYTFVDRVHRIFGDRKNMASHLLDASFDVGKVGTLRAYAYLLDYENVADAGLSTSTFGLELAGKRELSGGGKFLYELEVAQQGENADNPGKIDAGYQHLMLGGALQRVTIKAGLEVLEGSPESGQFRTPLATLHKFNGWADKFLGTPADGLADLYLSAGGKVRKVSWLAVFHDFGAESTSANYGEELDFQLTFANSWGQVFGLKVALYDAETHAANTDKLMLWTGYKF